MRLTERQQAAMKATRMRELRKLGYKSDVFKARFAGKCPASGLRYPVGEPLCFFGDYAKPILATIANQLVETARRAAAPRCACGKEATVEAVENVYTLCNRCDFICEYYFNQLGCDVTRDSTPEI
jgi:hypothetical protein